MRDPNRLISFYDKIRVIHMNHFPDWRFGQLMYNFFNWVSVEKEIDIFFPEENRLIELLEEFVGDITK